jgi:hypothetical protein
LLGQNIMRPILFGLAATGLLVDRETDRMRDLRCR